MSVDIAFFILIALSSLFGVYKGMCRLGFPILGGIFGAYMGVCFYPVFLPYLQKYIPYPLLCKGVSFFIIFSLITVLCSLIGAMLHRIFEALSIGWLDRVGGLILGALKGWVIVCVVTVLLCSFFAQEKIFAQSRLFPYIKSFLQKVSQLFPAQLLEKTVSKLPPS
jgi:membrane protein required for colicin V production